jgi:hypothetical protein|tara:strand:+ start:577 stop:720 length:144 start_codon:yes stop_codon:yes gene_type:complete
LIKHRHTKTTLAQRSRRHRAADAAADDGNVHRFVEPFVISIFALTCF